MAKDLKASRTAAEVIKELRTLIKEAYQLEPEDGPTGRHYELRATYEEWASLLELIDNKSSEGGGSE